ncbi:MAG: hypothetical protein ABFS46_08545 [Myxococcota bacterium]
MNPPSEWLHAYYDGELGRLRRWRVQRWLARDPAARQELAGLSALGDAVREAVPEPALADLWDGLAGRLRSVDIERQRGRSERPAWDWLRAPVLRPLAAGAVVVALVAGLALLLVPDPHTGAGVVRWLDTGGQPVMVLDEGEATIIWLMGADGEQVRRGGGWHGLI